MKTTTWIGAIFMALFIVTFNSSCKKDDDNKTADCTTQGSLTMTLDGGQYTATEFNNTLLKATDPSTGLDAKRLDIRALDANGVGVILSLSEFRDGKVGNDFREDTYYFFATTYANGYCESYNGFDACNGALLTYYPDGFYSTGQFAAEGDENDLTQNITITDNDGGDLTISGTFKVDFVDPFSSQAHTIEGSFSNLCYRVLEQ